MSEKSGCHSRVCLKRNSQGYIHPSIHPYTHTHNRNKANRDLSPSMALPSKKKEVETEHILQHTYEMNDDPIEDDQHGDFVWE